MHLFYTIICLLNFYPQYHSHKTLCSYFSNLLLRIPENMSNAFKENIYRLGFKLETKIIINLN